MDGKLCYLRRLYSLDSNCKSVLYYEDIKMKPNTTTVMGYLGLLGQLMAALAVTFPNNSWSQPLGAVGLLLAGANGIGNIKSAEDSEVVKKPGVR